MVITEMMMFVKDNGDVNDSLFLSTQLLILVVILLYKTSLKI